MPVRDFFLISILNSPHDDIHKMKSLDNKSELCRSVEEYSVNNMFLSAERVNERSPFLEKNEYHILHNDREKLSRKNDIHGKLFDDKETEVMPKHNGVHILADGNKVVSNNCDAINHNVLPYNNSNQENDTKFLDNNMINDIAEENNVCVEMESHTKYVDNYCKNVVDVSEENYICRPTIRYNLELDVTKCENNSNNIQSCIINGNDSFSIYSECAEPLNETSNTRDIPSDLTNTCLESHTRTVVSKNTVNRVPLHPGLRLSLFPGVPPYIFFSTHDKKGTPFPPLIRKQLRWKMSTITPAVVKQIVTNSGFRLLKKSTEWGGTWGKHVKSICFKTVHEHQKMNHFPGTFQLGRKDRLWKNIQKFMMKFGFEEFGFMPETYILPYDIKNLKLVWGNKEAEKWIIKPPASARGVGIKVIHKWCQIPRKSPIVVQRYISDPYLINGTKFDLRLYVLVTSFNPLRLYLYDNGLVRFASVKYSSDLNTLSDRYMHLTNYSINKLSAEYTHNEDVHACHGHKWTIKTLWNYLEKEYNVDTSVLWYRLTDLVVKTIVSTESPINKLVDANRNSRYNCYELFGVDILFDEQLKPWLLEVNISPSLHSSSTLDLAVKGPLVRDLFNVVGFQIPTSKKCTEKQLKRGLGNKLQLPVCYDKRLYIPLLSPEEKDKHIYFEHMTRREEYLVDILDELTSDDVRHLIQYEDELTQVGSFCRIFPTRETHSYFKFFDSPKYYNYLLDAWETKYHDYRQQGIELLKELCSKGVHSDVSLVNDNTATTCKIHQKYKLNGLRNYKYRLKTNRKAINHRWI